MNHDLFDHHARERTLNAFAAAVIIGLIVSVAAIPVPTSAPRQPANQPAVASPQAGDRWIEGTVLLSEQVDKKPGSECAGSGENAELRGGAAVEVVGPSGELVASTRLSSGKVVGHFETLGLAGDRKKDEVYARFGGFCEFAFVVDGLPKADAYTVRVPGAVERLSKAELRVLDWSVDMLVGFEDEPSSTSGLMPE